MHDIDLIIGLGVIALLWLTVLIPLFVLMYKIVELDKPKR